MINLIAGVTISFGYESKTFNSFTGNFGGYCDNCDKRMGPGRYVEYQGMVLCMDCYVKVTKGEIEIGRTWC